MPVDASIPLSIQAPDPMAKISSVLQNRAQMMQNQVASDQLKERNALAKIDFSKFRDSDGVIDADSAAAEAMKAAPKYLGPQRASEFYKLRSDQLAVNTGMQVLTEDQKRDIGQSIGALAGKEDLSKADIHSAISQFKDTASNPAIKRMADVQLKYLDQLADKPDVLRQGLLQMGRAVQPAAAVSGPGGVATPQADQVDTGSVIQPGVRQPGALGGGFTPNGPGIQKTPGPTILTDPRTGNIFEYDPTNNSVRPAGAGRSAPGVAPPVMGPGEAHSIESNVKQGSDMAWANRNAAGMARTSMDALNKIESLADKAQTGPGSQEFASLKTAIGEFTGFKGAANSATDTNKLAKLVAQVAVQRAQGLNMGGSDARLDEINKSGPNTKVDPEALKYVAQYTRALDHAALAKGDAQAKWYEDHGQNFATHGQFEDKWRQAADPHVFQAAEMSDDKAKKFYKGLSDAEKSKFRDSYQKLKDMGAIQ